MLPRRSRELDISQHFDRHHAGVAARSSSTGWAKREGWPRRELFRFDTRRLGEDFAVDGVQELEVPRPKTWKSLRSAIILRIQLRSEEGSLCCASTLIAS